MNYITKPWKHQREAVEFLYSRDNGALYTDMGSGKTKIMIDLIRNRGFKNVLIVCPKKVCSVWEKEFTKHASLKDDIGVYNIGSVTGNKRYDLATKPTLETATVYIINYEGVWREPLRKYFLNKANFDAVICDESHRIKSPSSKVSRFLTLLGRRVPNRYLMTGTPLSQSPLDIYAQYRFLDPTIFGTNFGNFKNRYANWVPMPGGFSILDKRNPYKNLDELREKMFSCAFSVDVDLNLPPTQDIEVEFELGKEAVKHYKTFKRDGLLELKEGYVEAGNVLALMLRLQQVTSGYATVQTDSGEKVVEVDQGRKKALQELLEDLPADEPVVIFAKYRKDIKNIREACGDSVSEISGKADEIKEWVNGDTKYLVVQISSGAEGIDLTRAKYCIYYSLGHSLGQYKQSRKRVHRPGQTRPVIYYTLIAKLPKGKTIDENIVTSLRNNQDLIDSIIKDPTQI